MLNLNDYKKLEINKSSWNHFYKEWLKVDIEKDYNADKLAFDFDFYFIKKIYLKFKPYYLVAISDKKLINTFEFKLYEKEDYEFLFLT